ncbi:Sp212, partial [Drosophila busckii]
LGLLLLLALALLPSNAQQLPENACTQYFQYVSTGVGVYQGELTLALRRGHNRIDVRFSQRNSQPPLAVDSLLPYPDDQTVRRDPANAKFRLKLLPDAVTGLLPKLTRLAYNEQTLCAQSEYSSPSSYFNRFYEIGISFTQPPPFWMPAAPPVISPIATVDQAVEVKTISGSTLELLPKEIHDGFDIPSWFKQDSQTTAPAFFWPTPTSPTSTAITAVSPTAIASTAATAAPRMFNFGGSNTLFCGMEGRATPFIQKGREYPRGTYPWLSAIYHKESFALAFKCGGSLVSASMVITAAHCVYKMHEDRIVVGLGRHDLDNYREEGAEICDVLRINIHPDYSSRLQSQPDADIALLKLQTTVSFNDIISPICLWQQTEGTTISTATIAGWGTDEDGNAMTRYPRVVDAKIASEAECARKWKVQKVLERTLCAGNLDGSGPCLGDSGGGLMVKHNNRWLLRGIVSLGERSAVSRCNLNQYVLYCDLSKHTTWIQNNLS